MPVIAVKGFAMAPTKPSRRHAAPAREDSSSSTSCLHSDISTTGSVAAGRRRARPQRAAPRIRDAGQAGAAELDLNVLPPGFETQAKLAPVELEASTSECSEVISGGRGASKPAFSESSSCLQPSGPAQSRVSLRPYATIPDGDLESDLACPEKLSPESVAADEEDEAYSSARDEELTLSDFEAQLFGPDDESDSIRTAGTSSASAYSSDDSARSRQVSSSSDAGASSPTFEFFLKLARQFTPCTILKAQPAPFPEDEATTDERKRFEDDEDEESYVRFRGRERREAAVHDYGKEYGSAAAGAVGQQIMEQRLVMVHWIVAFSIVDPLVC